jgi:hypothetical protein
VDVEKCKEAQPYLGGYRSKKTGLEYYNAFAQTDQYAKPHPTKNHREIQTYQFKTRSTKMRREFGSQSERPGIFIDKSKDQPISFAEYETSQQWLSKIEKKTLFIQCIYRAWKARK